MIEFIKSLFRSDPGSKIEIEGEGLQPEATPGGLETTKQEVIWIYTTTVPGLC